MGLFASRRHSNSLIFRLSLGFIAAVLGHVICLGIGAIWLATKIGFGAALAKGVYPFLVGGLLKSAALALLMAFIGTGSRLKP